MKIVVKLHIFDKVAGSPPATLPKYELNYKYFLVNLSTF